MIRTQIRLSEEQAHGLKRLAAQRGVSTAELIREGVERVLADSAVDERWQRASEMVGKYRDSGSDVAANHDHYLEEAYLP
jgi:predicted DNA-binding protein